MHLGGRTTCSFEDQQVDGPSGRGGRPTHPVSALAKRSVTAAHSAFIIKSFFILEERALMPPGGSGAWTRCGSPDTSWAAVFCGQNGVRGHGIGPRAVGLAVSWSEGRGGGNGATLGRGSPGESGRGPGGTGSVMGGRAPALHWGGGGQGHLHRGRPWGTAHPQTPQRPPSPGLRPAKASPARGRLPSGLPRPWEFVCSAGQSPLSQWPWGLGTANRAWAGGRWVKAGTGVVSRPGRGSRRNLWSRPVNSRNSVVLARLSPAHTRRPATGTRAGAGPVWLGSGGEQVWGGGACGGDPESQAWSSWLLGHSSEWPGRGRAGGPELRAPLVIGLRALRAAVPVEKGRKAARFTKCPLASRKWPGLNWWGVSHCVLSRSTELSRGITGVPCGQGSRWGGHPLHPSRPRTGVGEGGRAGRWAGTLVAPACCRSDGGRVTPQATGRGPRSVALKPLSCLPWEPSIKHPGVPHTPSKRMTAAAGPGLWARGHPTLGNR